MDRNHVDRNDHGNNINDSEADVKLEREFCSLVQQPGMDHIGDIDVVVRNTKLLSFKILFIFFFYEETNEHR